MNDEGGKGSGESPIPTRVIGLALGGYGVLAVAAYLWLWMRGRDQALASLAVGEHGALVAALVGGALGLALAGASALAARRIAVFTRFEAEVRTLLGPLGETAILVLALVSGLAEELFFRAAMQDALGLWITALAFGLLHAGPGALRIWPMLAGVVGLGFGWLVEAGFGLLSVSIAHALTNYLSLRRIACP